jgi:tRNA/rRNA methyltransferase
MSSRVNLDNISIVLNEPRYPENIGASARAAMNMGVGRVLVVNPQDWNKERILKMATHVAADRVADMAVYGDLETALGPFQFVVGTTARIGRKRRTIQSPRQMAERLIATSRNNRIALLFGSENRGLTNADLAFCHAVVTIPTAEFSSLNLAQAVMVMCYEIFVASREGNVEPTPRLATRRELEDMYGQLKETLVNISFVNPENPDYWMQQLRRALSRIDLRARDVRMIRGLCRQIEWYGEKGCRRDE